MVKEVPLPDQSGAAGDPVAPNEQITPPSPSDNLYNAIVDGLPVGDFMPENVIVDQEGDIYVSVKDAAQLTGLSLERLRGLVWEQRLAAVKPGGHDLFVSLKSTIAYTTHGRKPPGRPRKTHP